jgi:urease accessory protein
VSGTVVEVAAGSTRAAVRLVDGAVAARLVGRDSSSAEVALVAGGALLLPGDEVDITVRVGPGARLRLIDIGGTVGYGGDGTPAHWRVRIEVAAGGSLSWAGLPLIVADGAVVHRDTRLRLAAGATAVLRETTVLGRTGECGGELWARLDIGCDGRPLLVEDLRVRGAAPEPGVLGGHRVYDTVLAAGERPEPMEPERVLELDGPGALARYLGADLHESPLDRVFEAWTGRAELIERNDVETL